MAYYRDLRGHLKALEERGLLTRIDAPVNKDTELHPLVRLQFRGLPEEQRRAFLFTNIYDSRGRKYDIPVAVCALAGSSEIYATGMMCPKEEIAEKLSRAEISPIPPRLVSSGTVQDEVHTGDSLMAHGGLDEFPVPISTPGFDCAPYFTAPCWITKDPETGVYNVAVYRAQLKSPTRTGVNFSDVTQHGLLHWRKCRERGIPLQAAIAIGGPPSITYAAVSRFPVGVNELAIAGGIAGEPLEMVRCKTIDLEVPAHAEVVVEGELSMDELELEAPFGEAAGFMGLTEKMPYFKVRCITHRKDPIWLAMLSQFPPSESSKIRQHANEGTLYRHLRYKLSIESVLAVAFHESACSNALIVIQMKKADQADVWRALDGAGERYPRGKTTVAVDEDIDPWDIEAVNWAIGFRMQPHRDCRIVKYGSTWFMDPSLEPHEALEKRRHSTSPEKAEASRILINATLKWPCPPVSLPRKEYMEAAVRLWEKVGLPQLRLKRPWWGYSLGYWPEEYDRWAQLALKGEYYKTGEERARNRFKT